MTLFPSPSLNPPWKVPLSTKGLKLETTTLLWGSKGFIPHFIAKVNMIFFVGCKGCTEFRQCYSFSKIAPIYLNQGFV